jgi:hypothetical protein
MMVVSSIYGKIMSIIFRIYSLLSVSIVNIDARENSDWFMPYCHINGLTDTEVLVNVAEPRWAKTIQNLLSDS